MFYLLPLQTKLIEAELSFYGQGQPKCLSDQQFIRRHKKEEKVTTFLSQVTREQNPSQSLTEK